MRLLRDPLAQFVLLGLLLFALYRGVGPHGVARQIRVTDELRAGLRAEEARRSGHAVTPAEERAALDRYLADEALYREALALGLERGDLIVRRRMIQKMELLLGGAGEPPRQVPQATLRRYYEAHLREYARPARMSIEQVYFRSTRPEADAQAALAALRQGAAPETLGDPFLHGRSFVEQEAADLDRLFGPGVGEKLAAISTGSWAGPVKSSYGLHLVRVLDRASASSAAFDAVRERVQRDYLAAERARQLSDGIARTVARYEIVK